MKSVSAGVWFAMVLLCAANSAAQPRVFVEGTIAADLDTGGSTGTLGIGSNIATRYDVRYESEFASWDVTRDAGCGSHACLELNYATRATSNALLLGRHFQRGRRFRVDLLGGLGVLAYGLHATGYFDSLAADRTVASHYSYDDRSTERFAAWTLGLDAALLVAKHVSVVPQWRIHSPIGTYYAYKVRSAGVAARWQFRPARACR